MGCTESRKFESTDIAVEILNPNADKGETPIYRSPKYKDKLLDYMKQWPEVKTLQQLYIRAFKEYKDHKYLGTRVKNPDGTFGDYVWKTYGEVQTIAQHLGSGIVSLDLGKKHSEGDLKFLGIWAKTREEWGIVEIATAFYGFTMLPAYDTLDNEGLKSIFDSTQVKTFFCSGDKITKLIEGVASKQFASLKNIVSFDAISPEQTEAAKAAGVTLYNLKDVCDEGAKKAVGLPEIKASDIYTFCYTSGTTNIPKAAMLDHTCFISVIGAAHDVEYLNFEPGSVHLSYLPLAHIYERWLFPHLSTRGVAIGYFNGNPQQITDDLKALKPTHFIGVPRLFNRFHDTLRDKISKEGKISKSLAEHTIETKIENLKDGKYEHALWDWLVCKDFKQVLGGQTKFCLSGAAPLSREVGDFLKAAFACPIYEGYGATETTAPCHIQFSFQSASGDIGGPLGSIEYKLVDVPELGYVTKVDEKNEFPRGEIWVRGHSIFKGYFKDQAQTSEALQDGWYKTGDVGMILQNKALKIIDRKKNIFKLSQGEYVAPERTQNIYLTSKYVSEAWVYGNSLESWVVGVLVIKKAEVEELARNLQIQGTYPDILQDKKLRDAVRDDCNRIGKEKGLKPFELASAVYLEQKGFAEQGLCTTTMKVKRKEVEAKYKDIVAKLYEETKEVKKPEPVDDKKKNEGESQKKN